MTESFYAVQDVFLMRISINEDERIYTSEYLSEYSGVLFENIFNVKF